MKGMKINLTPPKKGSLCMIYATRPGDVAFERERMTLKLIKHMKEFLNDKEKGWILLPDDI